MITIKEIIVISHDDPTAKELTKTLNEDGEWAKIGEDTTQATYQRIRWFEGVKND